MGAPRNTLRVFNAGVSLCRLVCRRPQAAKPVLRRGSSRSAFPLWGKAVMAYPPTGSVQTECTRLPVMLRTKGRFLCQRTIGFVGLQKHINSGYAFAERQIAHNGKRGKGTAYFLQAYRDSPDVIHPGFTSYTKTELEQFQKILLRTIPSVSIRGID